MQKEPAKELFIDSSCRRSGILRSLIKRLLHTRDKEEMDEGEFTYRKPPSHTDPGRNDGLGDGDNLVKKEAS